MASLAGLGIDYVAAKKSYLAAYKRGEKPISHWKKEIILDSIADFVDETGLVPPVKKVMSMSHRELKERFLIPASTQICPHGKYWLETTFYALNREYLEEISK